MTPGDPFRSWRWAALAILFAIFGPPLVSLAADLVLSPAAARAWAEGPRLLRLTSTTALLVFAVLAVTLPLGTLAAILIERSDLPGRLLLRSVVVLALFVPLPLAATAWQAALGGGVLSVVDPAGWRPWAGGFGRAVLVHAVAALPWVIGLVGLGLLSVESAVEDDALTSAPPGLVLWRVTLPRALPALAAAALWVGVMVLGEITVTDVFQVRTLAEEVYTQFVAPEPDGSGGRDALARAVLVTLPPTLLVVVLTLAGLSWCQRRWPPLPDWPRPRPLLRLGVWRWPLVALAGLALLLVIVPVFALVAQAGQDGSGWTFASAGRRLITAGRLHGRLIAESVAVALVSGVLAGTLALAGCWLLPGRRGLVLAAVVAWVLPGPVIGLALKGAIDHLLTIEETLGLAHGPLRQSLYDGPSPLPVIWASVVRFTPVAALLLWPVVRLLPTHLRDAARADGASAWQEWRHVVWPGMASAWLRAVLVVTALSLGELSASKLVETPGGQTFAHELFTQMHYGVTADLAALGLVQLLLSGAAASLVLLLTGPRK